MQFKRNIRASMRFWIEVVKVNRQIVFSGRLRRRRTIKTGSACNDISDLGWSLSRTKRLQLQTLGFLDCLSI